ncbi:hypothetical protein XELAEV_18031659mg [Xenopus laevis]|uniref:Uncharacterized protein n=1 Tax=Xenopus laevis TaxID=8355 RepID=A0A974HFZ6_XENLA|nr:hypothetical protein XELAEV_18031659mg [Xenopus laevis]
MWRHAPTAQPCCGDLFRQANLAVETRPDMLSGTPTAQTFCGDPQSDSPHAMEPRAPSALPLCEALCAPTALPCYGDPMLQQPKHAVPHSDSPNMLGDPRSDSPMLWSLVLRQPLHTVELRTLSALPCCGAPHCDSPSTLWSSALCQPFHAVEHRTVTALPCCGAPHCDSPSTLWRPALRPPFHAVETR